MIEENIISMLDIGEGIEILDTFQQKKFLTFCRFMNYLMSGNQFPYPLYLILNIIFYIQICSICLFGMKIQSKDYIFNLFKSITNAFLFEGVIKDKNSYIIALIVLAIFTIFIIVSVLYFLLKKEKLSRLYKENIFNIFLNKLLNIIFLAIIHYFFGPIIQICLMSTKCKNGTHKYLNVSCFSNAQHLVIFVISIFFILFYIFIAIILSMFYNEIGNLHKFSIQKRIRTNYDFYTLFIKIVIFVLHFYLDSVIYTSKIARIALEAFLFLVSIWLIIYNFLWVYYYDNRMNYIFQLLPLLTAWLCLIACFKNLFDYNNNTIFIVVGWLLFIYVVAIRIKNSVMNSITNIKILQTNKINEIELFINSLLSLIDKYDKDSQTIVKGYILRFEERLFNLPELYEKYKRLKNIKYFRKYYTNENCISIYCFIFIIYDYYIGKDNYSITLNFCYFLLNYIKNTTLCIYHLSKIHLIGYCNNYYKYVLIEAVQNFLVNKIDKSLSDEELQSIQISSAILYNSYQRLLKLKIFDSICNHMEYFEQFKSLTTTSKTPYNILTLGNQIIDKRNEIKMIWDKISSLNPFSRESENDYLIYLKNIIQDDFLTKMEQKNILMLKHNYVQKKNIYDILFDETKSSVLLVDGKNSNGQIFYHSPNFNKLFMAAPKEISTIYIKDLIPSCIKYFHDELVEESIKYSNFEECFSEKKNFVLSGKNNLIYKIKVHAKTSPNLLYGLSFIIHLEKVVDNTFMIIVDGQLKIIGFTEKSNSFKSYEELNKENYGLNLSHIGTSVCSILPEIVPFLEYKNNEFNIITYEKEIKGNLYPVTPMKNLSSSINILLNKIKNCRNYSQVHNLENSINPKNADNSSSKKNDPGKSNSNLNFSFSCIEEKNELADLYVKTINEITALISNPFKIFYKIIKINFLNDKYKFYQIIIKDDFYNDESDYLDKTKTVVNFESTSINKVTVSSKNMDGLVGIRYQKTKNKNDINLLMGKNHENEEENKGKISNDSVNNQNNKKEENKEEENIEEKQKIIEKKGTKKNSILTSMNLNEKESHLQIKEEIIKKNMHTKYEIRLIIFNIIFFIISIVLIIYDSIINKKDFTNISNYLEQKLFLNSSKLEVSRLYMIACNFIYLKNGYTTEHHCLSNICSIAQKSHIFESSNSLKLQMQKIKTNYESDSYEILTTKTEMYIMTEYNTTGEILNMTYLDIIDYLIYNSLLFLSDYRMYFENTTNKFTVAIDNILKSSDLFSSANLNDNRDKTIQKKEIKKKYISFPICLVIQCILIFTVILYYTYIIISMFNIESIYSFKLIDFSTPSFEGYLKNLDEIRRILKNEENENEESEKDDDMLLKGQDDGSDVAKRTQENIQKVATLNNHKKNDKLKEKKIQHKKKDKNKISKIQDQIRYKKKVLYKFFLMKNITFILEVIISLILLTSYFIISLILKNTNVNSFLGFESTIESIESLYTDSFLLFIVIKREIHKFGQFYHEKTEAIKQFENGAKNATVNGTIYYNIDDVKNLKNYNMSIPDYKDLVTPKVNNLLMSIIKDADTDKEPNSTMAKLNKLFNVDACSVIFTGNKLGQYKSCSNFWSGVLNYGAEQTITEMGLRLMSVRDDLIKLNDGDIDMVQLLSRNNNYLDYGAFVEYYLYEIFITCSELFEVLRSDKVKQMKKNINILLCCFSIWCVFILFALLFFIYNIIMIFNGFLVFVCIIPIKYLTEDMQFFKEIKKLEKLL